MNETGVRLWLVMDGIHPQWLSYPKTACTNGEGVDHVSKVEEENDAIDMSDSRQAVLKDLEYMFQPAFARSYVHEIKTTALRDIPHASYWAHEAIEEWFKSGDMNAPIHELLRKDVETSARDFYVSMGRSVDNYSLAHAVTQEIMQDLHTELPKAVHDARPGSWVNVNMNYGSSLLPMTSLDVFKVPPTMSLEQVVTRVRVHCYGELNSSPVVWFRAERHHAFESLCLGASVANISPSGCDCGSGITMFDALDLACSRVRGRRMAVAVYRDLDISKRCTSGVLFLHPEEAWRQMVETERTHFVQRGGRALSNGFRSLSNVPWVQGPYLTPTDIREGTWQKEDNHARHYQLFLKDIHESEKWRANLIAMLVFE